VAALAAAHRAPRGTTQMSDANKPEFLEPPPPWRPAFMPLYDKVLARFDKVIELVVTVTMGVLTSVVIISVFFRYVLNTSVQWGWDIPRLCFIWVVLLSIPLVFRYNAHVGMDFDLTRFGIVNRKAVNRFNAVFMLILFSLTSFYAVQLVVKTWDQLMPGIDLSVGLLYVGLLVGMVHSCLHVGRILILGETSNEVLSES
jgi:TRAP-type C4-dicarboxylate transport system permease small subunit